MICLTIVVDVFLHFDTRLLAVGSNTVVV